MIKLYYNTLYKKYGIMTAIDVLDRYLCVYTPGLKNIREISLEEAINKIRDENYEFALNEKRGINMKLYRNYTKSDDGIMTAEDVLDKYLYTSIWAMSNIARITEREVAVAVLDEGYTLSPKIKAYLTRWIEEKTGERIMHMKDWQIAVALLTIDNKQE